MSIAKSKLTYSIERTQSVLTAKIKGAITSSDSHTLSACFKKIIDSEAKVVNFDFSDVPLVTSQYVGEIVLLYRTLEEQGRELSIVGIQDELLLLFQAIKLDKVITLKR